MSPRGGALSDHAPAVEGGTSAHSSIQLSLLPDFSLAVDERPVPLCGRVERALSLLALQQGSVPRTVVAGTLWPEVADTRASASLRTCLRLVPEPVQPALLVTPTTLQLAPSVAVDLEVADHAAHRVISRVGPCPGSDVAGLLRHDLLAHWREPWLEAEQLRFHQLRLHAMEALCYWLSSEGRHAEAVEVGLSAVVCEPLRESAHEALIAAHLAEGNRLDALAQYRRCEELLEDELGLPPGPRCRSRLDGLLPDEPTG